MVAAVRLSKPFPLVTTQIHNFWEFLWDDSSAYLHLNIWFCIPNTACITSNVWLKSPTICITWPEASHIPRGQVSLMSLNSEFAIGSVKGTAAWYWRNQQQQPLVRECVFVKKGKKELMVYLDEIRYLGLWTIRVASIPKDVGIVAK